MNESFQFELAFSLSLLVKRFSLHFESETVGTTQINKLNYPRGIFPLISLQNKNMPRAGCSKGWPHYPLDGDLLNFCKINKV